MARTLFEAVNAIEWFADSYWHGPKPRRDTVDEVCVVGDPRTWKVPAASVERWQALDSRAGQAALDYFKREGVKGGKKSGKARMEKLTPEKRSEIAKKAAAARWSKKRK